MVKKQLTGFVGRVFCTGIFSILCMGLAIGGEGMATQVAAKHLKDYEWLRKASGEEDAIALLRMQSEYQSMVRGEVDDIWATSYAEEMSLREKAYDLAESRYKQGLGTVRDVYETGIELYARRLPTDALGRCCGGSGTAQPPHEQSSGQGLPLV